MKNWMIPALLGVGLLAPGEAGGQERSKLAAQHGWLNDLEQGKALARRTNRPLMVVFRCEP